MSFSLDVVEHFSLRTCFDNLKDMQEEATKPERNPYKIRAFSTAIKAVKQLERPIVSVEEVRLVRDFLCLQ